jgi:hypothetical protein
MPRFSSLGAGVLVVLPGLIPGVALHPGAVVHPRPAQAASQLGPSPASPAWRLALTSHFGGPGNASGYATILMAGRRTWVFGGTNPGGQSSPVAARRTGDSWTPVALPGRLTDFISDASATSASNIWAVSGYGRYVLHWNGSGWRVAKTWRRSGTLSDVVAAGPRQTWVFGTSATGTRSIGTWRFDGQSWETVGGIASDIYRASAVSSRDIWAIAAGPRGDTILNLSRRHDWRRIPAGRATQSVRWHDILAESRKDVWLLGDTASRTGSGLLELARWNGTRWAIFSTRVRAWAGQLAAAGPDRVLATATSTGNLTAGLVVAMTDGGRKTWSSISSSLGSGVSDVAYAPRTGTIWASGATLTRLGGDAAVWVRAVARSVGPAGPNPAGAQPDPG